MLLGLLHKLTILVTDASFGTVGYDHADAAQSFACDGSSLGIGLYVHRQQALNKWTKKEDHALP